MEWKKTYDYAVAGRKVSFDRPVQRLSAWVQAEKEQGQRTGESNSADPLNQLVETEGWLLDDFIHLSTHYSPDGVRMEISGSGMFEIDPRGRRIEVVQRPVDERQFEESLLGPPLILALALRDVWCLHASAVRYRESCLVFLGDSGRGKSTLAAYLAGQAGCSLVSDDILPIESYAGQVRAYANFPQLKLPVDGVGERQDGPIQVCGFFLLEETPQVAMVEVEKGMAATTLIHNTVAARAFNQELLADHLDFCIQAAMNVPIYRLMYPRAYSVLPEVAEKLKDLMTIDERQPLEYREEG